MQRVKGQKCIRPIAVGQYIGKIAQLTLKNLYGTENMLSGVTNGSLMKVKSIAECSPWNILQCLRGAFCNTFDLH